MAPGLPNRKPQHSISTPRRTGDGQMEATMPIFMDRHDLHGMTA